MLPGEGRVIRLCITCKELPLREAPFLCFRQTVAGARLRAGSFSFSDAASGGPQFARGSCVLRRLRPAAWRPSVGRKAPFAGWGGRAGGASRQRDEAAGFGGFGLRIGDLYSVFALCRRRLRSAPGGWAIGALRSVCHRAYRSPRAAIGVCRRAVQLPRSAPTGRSLTRTRLSRSSR